MQYTSWPPYLIDDAWSAKPSAGMHHPTVHPALREFPKISKTSEAQFDALDDNEKQEVQWQYQGYPGLSKWMASSNDFFVLRRFSKAAARSLLYLQNEIGRREKALDAWDEFSTKKPKENGLNGSFEQERIPERTILIQELCHFLQQYYDLASSFSQIKSRPSAQEHELRNLKNWFETYPQAIDPLEQHFLDKDHQPLEGDLFPIVARPKSPLRWLLHKSRFLRFRFPLKHRPDRIKSPLTKYHSDTGFDNMVCTITVLIGLALLFAPMWCLHYVNEMTYMLAIITGFVTLFAFWLWVAAGPRQFEILLGTAAYAAVLYIYLQVAGGGAKSPS